MTGAVRELFDPQELERLRGLSEHDPHHFLGLHQLDLEESASRPLQLVRFWMPGACEAAIEVLGKLHYLQPADPSGLFIYTSKQPICALDYRIFHSSGKLCYDPYAFTPTWGEFDLYLFSQGCHYQLDRMMGGRLCKHESVQGARFAVWAPNARAVSLVCDSNRWDGRVWPMRSMGGVGIWELFVPGLEELEPYKFEIHTRDGRRLLKADPCALYTELRPKTASILVNDESFPWSDQQWLQQRSRSADPEGYAPSRYSQPLLIYELHLGSWKRKEDGTPLNYRELAHELVRYSRQMGYTHVELLPLMEHPLDDSWGYQVTGYFSVTSRWGSLNDLKYLINYLHLQGIGVILDWVPAHFPTDEHGLTQFDGTALYEHADPRQGFHPHWQTAIFNYGRCEVANFLLASALYWCRELHADGLRVDAVASMIYLDYGRESGQWIPNRYGGKENLEAVEFLRHLNWVLHKQCPGVLTFAEESTSFLGVTQRLIEGGLGFDFKWNMGWMNDTLRYIARDPLWRSWHRDELAFAFVYAFSERFALVLSHDEVVHGKGSLISRMPGGLWQRFANMRLLYSYMICMPGKKLHFMGSEIAQCDEWDFNASVQWHLLHHREHRLFQACVRAINHFYLEHSELWYDDVTPEGFSWVDSQDRNTLAYFRHSPAGRLLCIHHFSDSTRPHYSLKLEGVRYLREVLNSDQECFGGSGQQNGDPLYPCQEHFTLQLAPLATQIFEAHGE